MAMFHFSVKFQATKVSFPEKKNMEQSTCMEAPRGSTPVLLCNSCSWDSWKSSRFRWENHMVDFPASQV